MLPIIDGNTRSYLSVKTGSDKKKYAMSYSFHVDTGDLADKAGEQIQYAAKKGYNGLSRFVRRKYREMKVKKALNVISRKLSPKIKLYLPIRMKSLKSRIREAVHL